jgi:hypothetical protein
VIFINKKYVEYLGHIFSREGIKVDPQNIQDIKKWSIPQNIKSLSGFFGLIRYYRFFFKNYAHIAGTLTYILKKNSFVWKEDTTLTLSLLKDAMYSTPVLETPNFGKTFIVECDALGQGIEVVLTQ